jgi:uncharacterized membrane protein
MLTFVLPLLVIGLTFLALYLRSRRRKFLLVGLAVLGLGAGMVSTIIGACEGTYPPSYYLGLVGCAGSILIGIFALVAPFEAGPNAGSR